MDDMVRTEGAERGRTLLQLGRADEAERELRAVLAAHPHDPDLTADLARALLAQRRFEDALEAGQLAVALDPQNVDALVVLSGAQACLGELDRALATVRHAIGILPTWGYLHRRAGTLLLALDRPDEALESLTLARRLDPLDADTLVTMAEACFALRRFDDAGSAVGQALELDPENAGAHRLRGLLAMRRGGSADAVEAQRTALRLDPSDPVQRELLAVAMKGRNPLYAALFRLGDTLDGLPRQARVLALFAPALASRLLRPYDDQLWARLLVVALVLVVLGSWMLEPVMNTVLLCTRYGRGLLSTVTRRATYAFLGFAASGVACAAYGLASASPALTLCGVGFGVWSASVGAAHLVAPGRRRLMVGLGGGGALVGLAATAVAVASGASGLAIVFVLAGVAMLWFAALA